MRATAFLPAILGLRRRINDTSVSFHPFIFISSSKTWYLCVKERAPFDESPALQGHDTILCSYGFRGSREG